MKRVLKLKTPIVSVYSNIANAQGILLNYENGRKWIAENFINYVVYWDEKLKEIKPHFLSVSDVYLGGNYQMFSRNIFVPYLKCYTLDKDMVEIFGGIINLIKWAVDKGYYVSFFINRKYIAAANLVDDQMHETFVYGYDDELQEICLQDYFKRTALQEYRCSYDEIEKAFLLAQDYYLAEGKKIPITDIMLAKYDDVGRKELNREEFREKIRKNVVTYMEGENLGGKINFLHTSFEKESQKYWGIKCYDAFIRYFRELEQTQPQTKFVVVHHLHHLLDHKKSIEFMVREFYSYDGLEENDVIIEARKLVGVSDKLRNYTIKLWLSKHKLTSNEVDVIADMLETMKGMEKNIFNSIIEEQ